ncbi:MAG: hypothetical protein GX820_01120 [Bacteroidales bacterium]|nr:hypothetical protein [Bacteroidales bacterium]
MQLLLIGDMDKDKFYNLLANNLLLNNDTLPGLKELTEKYPYFQTALILLLKNLKQTANPEFESFLRRLAIMIPDRKLLFNYLLEDKDNEILGYYTEEAEIVTIPFEFEESEGEGNRLIDKFLSLNKRGIKIDRDSEKSTGTDSKVILKSLVESDELITETLANIYAEQKKYDKAVDAFKKLSLKYPEKSAYFALRIKEIEKNLK